MTTTLPAPTLRTETRHDKVSAQRKRTMTVILDDTRDPEVDPVVASVCTMRSYPGTFESVLFVYGSGWCRIFQRPCASWAEADAWNAAWAAKLADPTAIARIRARGYDEPLDPTAAEEIAHIARDARLAAMKEG